MEWLGEVPEHWEVKRLEHVAFYRTSSVDKKIEEDELPVRLCNYTDVYYGDRIRVSEGEFMNATASTSEVQRFRLLVGDILVTKDSEDWRDIAVPAIVDETADDFVCGYHLGIIRSGPGIHPLFLYRALQSEAINRQLQVSASGVTRYGLSNAAVGDVVLPLPPIDEQRAIGAFLDRETERIDSLVAKMRLLIERLGEYRTALITRTVTDGLPPEAARLAGVDPSPRLKPSGMEWLGEVPEHWEVKRLEHVAFYRTSNIDKKIEEDELPVRLCNYTDVYYGDRIRVSEGEFMNATASTSEVQRFRLLVGDILVTKDSEDWRDIAVPAIVDETADDFVCGYHLGVIRSGPGIHPLFLYRALQSEAVTFAAEDDDVDDFGESVKLTFGTTLPDRITRGAIQETTVNIWQFTALDCNAALLCADVSFADRTALDWGWYDLRYQASWDPASSITEDSFAFSGVRYTIHRIRLAPGVYPEMDNPWSRSLQDEAVLSFSIGHGASLTPPSQDHYRDWVLYLDDVTLPLSQATRFGRDFQWHGSAIQQIFADWTSSEPNRIGIMNIPFADQPQAVPPGVPRLAHADWSGDDATTVSWWAPRHDGGSAVTGYKVQWKEAADSWTDAAAVSEKPADSMTSLTGRAKVGGLKSGALYTVRVTATNAVGDGHPSAEMIARTEGSPPRVTGAVVNGRTLTLSYDKAMDTGSAPANSSFVVLVNDGIRLVDSVSIAGSAVTLTLSSAVTAEDEVTWSYQEPVVSTETALLDVDGNYAIDEERLSFHAVANETPRSSLQPLTAQFANVPASHDGAASFTFNIEFSESVWIGTGFPRDDLLRVTGGTVTSAHWLNRLTEEWSVTIRPETQGAITVVLPKQRYCVVVLSPGTREADLVSGAPCAAGDRQLSNQPEATITGPTSQQQAANNPATGAPTINGTARAGETLTATTTGISDSDGLAGATFTHQWLADDVAIDGATGSSYTVTDGDVGKAIKVRVSFTDNAGNAENLTSATTTPLTAEFLDIPESHDGSNAFTFELRFSGAPVDEFSYTTLRDHAFTVTGGEVSKVRRLEAGKNVRWEITVQPSSNTAVTIALPITTDCTVHGAICTGDGRKLSSRVELTISGPSG